MDSLDAFQCQILFNIARPFATECGVFDHYGAESCQRQVDQSRRSFDTLGIGKEYRAIRGRGNGPSGQRLKDDGSGGNDRCGASEGYLGRFSHNIGEGRLDQLRPSGRVYGVKSFAPLGGIIVVERTNVPGSHLTPSQAAPRSDKRLLAGATAEYPPIYLRSDSVDPPSRVR
jgi:hypothetical protein